MEPTKSHRIFGDTAFESHIRGLEPTLKRDVASEIGGLDLNTPDGIERARAILSTQLDLQYSNAENLAAEQISAVVTLLEKNNLGGNPAEGNRMLYKRQYVGLKEYNIVAPPPELLAEYKVQIDNIIAVLKTGNREEIKKLLVPGLMGVSGARTENNKDNSQSKVRVDIDKIMKLIESEDMTEQRYAVLAIGVLAGVNRSKGLTLMGGFMKVVNTKTYNAEKVFERDGGATCIDVGVLNKELLKMYSIESDVYIVGDNRTGHRFVVTSNNEVIDPWSDNVVSFSFDLSTLPDNIRSTIQREEYDLEL